MGAGADNPTPKKDGTAPADRLRQGYPADAKYDFAWPADFPYDKSPTYSSDDGGLFSPEEQGMSLDELASSVGAKAQGDQAPADATEQEKEGE